MYDTHKILIENLSKRKDLVRVFTRICVSTNVNLEAK